MIYIIYIILYIYIVSLHFCITIIIETFIWLKSGNILNKQLIMKEAFDQQNKSFG